MSDEQKNQQQTASIEPPTVKSGEAKGGAQADAKQTGAEKPKAAKKEVSRRSGKAEEKELLKPEEVKAGMEIRIHQKIKEGEKERVQIYEGVVLIRHGGKGVNATMTVRKISNGIGVEKIFPIHLPSIVKIEKVRQLRIRQSRPLYLRTYRKKLKEA